MVFWARRERELRMKKEKRNALMNRIFSIDWDGENLFFKFVFGWQQSQ
jgi:hypothetical protein